MEGFRAWHFPPHTHLSENAVTSPVRGHLVEFYVNAQASLNRNLFSAAKVGQRSPPPQSKLSAHIFLCRQRMALLLTSQETCNRLDTAIRRSISVYAWVGGGTVCGWQRKEWNFRNCKPHSDVSCITKRIPK